MAANVLLVDDHELIRQGLRRAFERTEDFTVVAEAASVAEAVSAAKEHSPDVVVVDVRLPDGNGLDVARMLREQNEDVGIVVLTMYAGDEDIYRALEAGAQGYLIKGMSHQVLIDAIRRVHSGLKYLPEPVVKHLAARMPKSDLSPRELEILNLIVKGKSNKEISAVLGITEGTVKCHVNVILSRLGVSDRTQAAVAALQRGIVHL
jgi:two-component system NarL family response regulator